MIRNDQSSLLYTELELLLSATSYCNFKHIFSREIFFFILSILRTLHVSRCIFHFIQILYVSNGSVS